MGRTHRLAFLVLLAAPLASAAGAQPSPAAEGPALTLEKAVELTLAHHPAIHRAREVAEESRATLLRAAGAFDSRFLVESHFSFDSKELFGDRLQFERDRRLRFEIASKALDRAADSIIAELPTAGSLLFDDCQPDQTELVVNAADGTRVVLCLNSQGGFEGINLGDSDFDTPSDLVAQLRHLEVLIAAGVEDAVEFFADLMRVLARQLRLTSSALRLARERLGALPKVEQFLQLDVFAARQYRYRNGIAFTASLTLMGSEDNFADKPLNPAFGDSVFPNFFTTVAGLTLDVPLGKGRGKVSTAGPERAAAASLRAVEELWAHTASERALETVTAYWRLAGAQERLRWIEESAAVQDDILADTEELVEADQLVEADLDRTRARVAETYGQAAGARQALVEARLDLRLAMGLSADLLDDAPLAAEGLPKMDPESAAAAADDPEAEIRQAFARRHDLLAALETSRAADILARAAAADLRPQVDLQLDVSYSGLYESFQDRVYDPESYWRAFAGELAGPSYGVGLHWVLPFGNNAARGRLLQAEASRSRSDVARGDLRRLIRLRLVELRAALERARAQLGRLRTSLAELGKTLESSRELYREGELTLIDTLLTEEQLTNARLAEVDAVSRIAELEAELQFEAARLLEAPPGGTRDYDPSRSRLVVLHPPS